MDPPLSRVHHKFDARGSLNYGDFSAKNLNFPFAPKKVATMRTTATPNRASTEKRRGKKKKAEKRILNPFTIHPPLSYPCHRSATTTPATIAPAFEYIAPPSDIS